MIASSGIRHHASPGNTRRARPWHLPSPRPKRAITAELFSSGSRWRAQETPGRKTISAPASPKALGSSENSELAVQWLTSAADGGDPVAQRNLAALWFKGEGVERDELRAAALYRSAAEQGDGPAQDMLSWMLLEGGAIPLDAVEARRFALAAAAQGIGAAMTRIGMLYHNALGVERDPVEAARWWREGAEAGDADGQAMLGAAYHLGSGVRTRLHRSLRLAHAGERRRQPARGAFSRRRARLAVCRGPCRSRAARGAAGEAWGGKGMIIGTAGHIDHGKTALVKALTGVDGDRLKEEKARGITIDLGFAYLPVATGSVLGFVDVPGHERFVHTMLAGASGIDFALLVGRRRRRDQAADAGASGDPGPARHQARAGRPDEGRSRLARAPGAGDRRDPRGSHRNHAAGRRYPAVSAVTGRGIATLRAHLAAAAASDRRPAGRRPVSPRCRSGRSRLSGVGIVVTGTVLSGSVHVRRSRR